jgi:bifunctional non-homologous end joining protein LigD
MALEEYKRKRRFEDTPEPPPKVEKKSGNRFVVQKHRATRLHYDFRLEMDGVLKSWAVPKGPSLDPSDKRLAMMVEDHPVSYFDFEGIIPEGNYGAGTVMVWDVGTWEPLGNAREMLSKGDLKFRLKGKKLNGEFVLAHMKSRRPGTKGNEWLMIKKKDDGVKPGFDAENLDWSVLTKRSLKQIAGDAGAKEWKSDRKASTGRVSGKNAWLADSIAKADAKKVKENTETRRAGGRGEKKVKSPVTAIAKKTTTSVKKAGASGSPAKKKASTKSKSSKASDGPAAELADLKGVARGEMPQVIQPMLATLTDRAFSSDDWLYEIKWDGYRAVAFIEDSNVRFVSRNQNEMTSLYPELSEIVPNVNGKRIVLDGEIVAFDEQGRPSFSMMQQRAGIRSGIKRTKPNSDIPVLYYVFDLLYLDGYNLMRVNLEQRKEVLRSIVTESDFLKYSEHFVGEGEKLFQAAEQRKLEGIVAKRRNSCYVQKRSSEWLKMKITKRQECVVGGYTDPKGSREHFGSLILGLYDDKGQLIHVGHAGSGFSAASHAEMWKRLHTLDADKSPFHGKVEATRNPHWVKPELVAEIKFTEWTHEGQSGAVKMRAPVFEGLRFDKDPRECKFEKIVSATDAA